MGKPNRREAVGLLLGSFVLSACSTLPKVTPNDTPPTCVWQPVSFDFSKIEEIFDQVFKGEGAYFYSRYGRLFTCVQGEGELPNDDR